MEISCTVSKGFRREFNRLCASVITRVAVSALVVMGRGGGEGGCRCVLLWSWWGEEVAKEVAGAFRASSIV